MPHLNAFILEGVLEGHPARSNHTIGVLSHEKKMKKRRTFKEFSYDIENRKHPP